MWSLDPNLRNNDIYKGLLKKFRNELSSIPWARTGLQFGENKGKADHYLRSYETNLYSDIFRNEIYDFVKELVLDENIKNMGVFNWKSLENTFKYIKSPLYRNNLALEEKLTWLASLSLFLKKYDISQVPVLHTNNTLTGMVTEMDLFEYILGNRQDHSPDETVEQVIQPPPPTFPANTPMRDVLSAIVDGHVVMVTESDHPVGILTQIDMLDYVASKN